MGAEHGSLLALYWQTAKDSLIACREHLLPDGGCVQSIWYNWSCCLSFCCWSISHRNWLLKQWITVFFLSIFDVFSCFFQSRRTLEWGKTWFLSLLWFHLSTNKYSDYKHHYTLLCFQRTAWEYVGKIPTQTDTTTKRYPFLTLRSVRRSLPVKREFFLHTRKNCSILGSS